MRRLRVLALGLAFGFTTSTASADTLTVTTNADSGTGSLRAQIAASSPGDTIDFDSSLSGDTITLTSGELLITHSLTITGLGASNLSVSGNGNSRAFDIDAAGGTVSISGLRIDGGKAPAGPSPNGDGGGLLIRAGTFDLNNATVSGNETTGTGGLTHNCASQPCGWGGGIARRSWSAAARCGCGPGRAGA